MILWLNSCGKIRKGSVVIAGYGGENKKDKLWDSCLKIEYTLYCWINIVSKFFKMFIE